METGAELEKTLRAQVEQWQPLYLAVFLGKTEHQKNWPSSYLRILRLVIHNDRVCDERPAYTDPLAEEVPSKYTPLTVMPWLDMSLVQRVFPGLSEQFTKSTLVKATALVRRLADLDLIDAA